jgi:hypothetical protein
MASIATTASSRNFVPCNLFIVESSLSKMLIPRGAGPSCTGLKRWDVTSPTASPPHA